MGHVFDARCVCCNSNKRFKGVNVKIARSGHMTHSLPALQSRASRTRYPSVDDQRGSDSSAWVNSEGCETEWWWVVFLGFMYHVASPACVKLNTPTSLSRTALSVQTRLRPGVTMSSLNPSPRFANKCRTLLFNVRVNLLWEVFV